MCPAQGALATGKYTKPRNDALFDWCLEEDVMPEGNESAGRRGVIGTQVNLPMTKAIEISFNSVKIRFGRSLITVSGIVLAIAFLMSIWTSSLIVGSLKAANDSKINLTLQQKGIDIDPDSQASRQEESKNSWLAVLSLLVCLVGITNAMLMSVTAWLTATATHGA